MIEFDQFCLQTNVFEITSCHLFVTQEELLAPFQRKLAEDFCAFILIWAEMKTKVHLLATKGYYCSCNLSPKVCTLQVSSEKLALGILGPKASHVTSTDSVTEQGLGLAHLMHLRPPIKEQNL